MSEKKPPIVEQGDALSLYMNDMLAGVLDVVISDDPVILEKLEQAASISIEQDATKDWRQHPFQVLVFDVQGLKLALPLHELNGISQLQTITVTPPPNSSGMLLGSFQHKKSTIQIINTAKTILPEHLWPQADTSQYIINIDRHWSLACDDVITITSVQPEQISWRQNTGSRPWLAGTVMAKKYSIIHVEHLIQLLTQP